MYGGGKTIRDGMGQVPGVRNDDGALDLVITSVIVSPSAVSHALRRLRERLRDDLFVSTDSSMRPTRRALEMAADIRDGLEKLELALTGKKKPGAEEALRTFRVLATDYACMVILPRLVERLTKSAPRVALQVSAHNRSDLGWHLDRGRCDFIIGSFNQPQPGQRRLKLLSEDEIIAVRNAHPLTHGEVTENRLLEFPQVIVAHGGAAEDQPDGYLRRGTLSETCVSGSDPWEFPEETINVTGRSTVRVPYFAAVAPLLQLTDMVSVLPRRLARVAAANGSIALLELPYPSPKLQIEMAWHQRSDHDQGLQWLLNELVESLRELD